MSMMMVACFGMGFMSFTSESRPEKLWMPQGSQALVDQDYVTDVFDKGERQVGMIVSPADGGNALRPEILKAHYTMYKDLQTISAQVKEPFREMFPGFYTLDNLCARRGDACFQISVLDFFNYDEALINSMTSTQDVLDRLNDVSNHFLVSGTPFKPEDVLAQIKVDSDGKILSATATRHVMTLKKNNIDYNNEEVDPPAYAVEKKINNMVLIDGTPPSTDLISVSGFTQTALQIEFGAAITGDIFLFAYGYMLIIGYATIMLGRFSFVRCKLGLTIAGVMSVGLSIVCCYGLCSAMGFFYGPVHNVLPFLLLGIGVDDMFIIVKAFQQVCTDFPFLPLEERVAKAIGHAGLSIFITSLTDFIAFAIGATTLLPALSSFCMYAAFGILFDFILQVTFFVGCMVIDTRRQEASRMDMCCCFTCEDEEAAFYVKHSKPNCSKVVEMNEMKDADSDKAADVEMAKSSEVAQETMTAAPAAPVSSSTAAASEGVVADDIQLSPRRETPGARLITKYYEPLFRQMWFKIAVIVGFSAWGITCMYGAAKLEQDFSFTYFIPGDSYLQNYYSDEDKYFPSVIFPVGLYTKSFDYYADRDTLNQISDKALSAEFLDGDVRSWYADYKLSAHFDIDGSDEFYTGLDTFFKNDGKRFATDVIWTNKDDPTEGLVSSRMFVNFAAYVLDNSRTEVKGMSSIRKMIASITPEEVGDEAFAYANQFTFWETYAVIEEELARNLGLSMMAICVIVTALIVHPITSAVVFLMVGLTIVNLVGCMYFWGIGINSVSVINLVVALGLAVDYSVHVGHNFMLQTRGDREQRMLDALKEVGVSVFNGAFSTFLAVLVLSFAESYIFIVFFKQFFIITIMGVAHGLIFLPVLMSLIGPPPFKSAIEANRKARASQNEVLATSVLSKDRKGSFSSDKCDNGKTNIEIEIKSKPVDE